ncbi:cytochrome c oxidase subunit 3 [Siccirubricoccus sp. KC 17139]|uniref:Cytochrome c oxidase subunit 3 n=1 Tax=Siccirubricoccus soli TaxID=2899147 RepID=A0ABT1CZH2_9PROT|nr:cytochrome c oxidase subunit 3 [Siccirubricoccus soli]MCO6415063.1 cytochrome c oxidase subunit 3 [Siccirubricoccus soli]MCP2681194.1 cytochrome c oxidase subunit 3 [Siccirubricoccus soli]
MKARIVADLSELPISGPRGSSPTWWGNLAFMLIEGTGFALAVAVYLYLATVVATWPPAPPPELAAGSGVALVLLLSLIPNFLLSRWAKAQDLRRVRLGLLVMIGVNVLPLALRVLEFGAFHVRWDESAYGSIVWVLLGLHTTHLLADLVETMVLAVLMFTRHADNPRRYGDVEDEVAYWYFIVATWMPVYACLYWVPRL